MDAPAGESLQDAQGQQTFDLEKEAAGMAWREIVFVELLDTKTPKSLCLAVGRIHAQLVELGFPLVRIHADAGTEFADDRLKEYASSRGILLTLAPPTEHDMLSKDSRPKYGPTCSCLIRMHLNGLWPFGLRLPLGEPIL